MDVCDAATARHPLIIRDFRPVLCVSVIMFAQLEQSFLAITDITGVLERKSEEARIRLFSPDFLSFIKLARQQRCRPTRS